MRDPSRITVEEFFAWHEHVEGRYELVDGHIVPHPDFVTPQGLAAPSNEHAAILANLGFALMPQLEPPCRFYAGAGVAVDLVSANVPDAAISCDPDDRTRKGGLLRPAFVFEILSLSTKRIDRGRKVTDYLAIESVEAYVVLDPEREAISVYRRDRGPETMERATGVSAIPLSASLRLPLSVFD
jgi:Uma2 family endonuclease